MNLPPLDTTENIKQTFTKERHVSRFEPLERLVRNFRPSERLALYILTIVLGASTIALLAGVNIAVSVEVPASGGSLTEGLVGPARFINPVLALSEADQDLTALVYSGLTRTLPDGTVIPDLASSYEISPDGMTYTFTLRPGAQFHDKTPVTAADVMFTIQLAQNQDTKSPHRADWEGVVVSSTDPQTILFKLPRAYAPFLQNTSMGILPQYLWKNIPAEDFPFSPLNTHPIGTGPYRVADVEVDNTGAAMRYELQSFARFTLGAAYLKHITFLFYPNEAAVVDAFQKGDINSIAGLSPELLDSIQRSDTQTITTVLPRVYGVFFNQGHSPALADVSARRALDTAIDKNRLVTQILHGYGAPLDSPVPPLSKTGAFAHTDSVADTSFTEDSITQARIILANGGWVFNKEVNSWSKNKQELGFALATADSPELVATAESIVAAWRAVGVNVTVKVFPLAELNSTVIRPREYDAILFGEIVGRELDLFAFWHSSQRNDPGLNLALYTNTHADTLLSQARVTAREEDRTAIYEQFAKLIRDEVPAVFLYAPEFIYVVPGDLQGTELGALTTASERFSNVHEWFTDTEYVWTFLTNKN